MRISAQAFGRNSQHPPHGQRKFKASEQAHALLQQDCAKLRLARKKEEQS